jgi:carbon starvation protein
MHRVIFTDFIDVGLCGIYIALILAMLSFAFIAIREARASETATVRETKDDLLRPIGA